MRAAILILALALTLPGCSKVVTSLAGGLIGGGGGPSVSANVQAGKNNAQVVGRANFNEQTMTAPAARKVEQSAGDTQVRTETVENLTVNESPVWLVLAFAVAVFMDSPLRWPGQVGRLITSTRLRLVNFRKLKQAEKQGAA